MLDNLSISVKKPANRFILEKLEGAHTQLCMTDALSQNLGLQSRCSQGGFLCSTAKCRSILLLLPLSTLFAVNSVPCMNLAVAV